MTKLETRILNFLRGQKKGAGAKETAKKLGISKVKQTEFLQALDNLVTRHAVQNQNGRFFFRDTAGLVRAEIVKVTGTFGFARPENEENRGEKDIFLPGRFLAGAMPGDKVLIKTKRGSGALVEGEVTSLLEARSQSFSGTVVQEGDGLFVLPDTYVKFPIRLEKKSALTLKPGDKILATLSERGERHTALRAKLVEYFGDADKAAVCCRSILAAGGISTVFPQDALEQAAAVAGGTGIHSKEIAVREDWRDMLICTIDGADSKDLDDAISLKKTEAGWELGVHIADVSYYVTHNSPLDLEAYRRGTSVYYADSVVPMLPPELSNGICSLNPDEDRLAFSAILQLDEDAALVDYRFAKTIIRSRVKGVYSEVNALLENTASDALRQKYAGLEELFRTMQLVAEKMTQSRFARGGMDLESPETKVILDTNGVCIDVQPRTRGISERIIEEFMLTANQAAALAAQKAELPFLYRVHDAPAPDRIQALYQVLDALGIKHKKPGTVSTGDMAAVLEQVKNTKYATVVNNLSLRAMAKAKYSPANTGHFGLVLKHYAHFTSPIRRYPDLVIHRILSGLVTGMKKENITKRFESFVQTAALATTEREIAAMTAERACTDCYKAEYMSRFVGQEFDGVISSVTAFGIYVQLPNTIEGLVRLVDFPVGVWGFDNLLSFTDSLTGNKLRLGDAVRVRIAGTQVSAGQVDMLLAAAT